MNEQIYGMGLLLNIASFFEGKEWKKVRQDHHNLKEEYQKYIQYIDDFSSLLGPLGRTLFGSVSVPEAEQAVNEIKKGNNARAEEILCKMISKMIPWYKIRFSKNLLRSFYIRKNILLLALKDHEEKRYHASIPVLLLCIDGIISDVTPEQKGAFSEGSHLVIPNSIVGYQGGLPQIIRLFSSVRRKTNEERIEIPYRNGILHGHDINYYNEITAHKTLALLFAVFDWVKDKQEYQKKTRQTPIEEKSWKDFFGDFKKNHDEKKYQENLLSSWEKRSGTELEIIVKERRYSQNTPEKLIYDNFLALKLKKYGLVAQQLGSFLMNNMTIKQYAGMLRNIMRNIEFLDFQIIAIEDEAPAVSQIEYVVSYTIENVLKKKKIIQRLIYENDEGTPLVRGASSGTRKTVFRIDDLLGIEFDLASNFLS